MKDLEFMIVGAQKSGTTALAEFLSQHGNIKVADGKEVHLFDDPHFNERWSTKEITEIYARSFSDTDSHSILGEATPIYMFIPELVERLARYNPKLKIIVLLRDPTERAYSQYRMEKVRGSERLPFWLALLLEKFRLRWDRDWLSEDSARRRFSYRSRGLYVSQLHNLWQYFPREQTLVLRNDELRDFHDRTLSQVFSFLGVPDQSVEAEVVFSHDGDISEVPVSAYFLRRSYRRELAQLQSIVEFSIRDWF